MERNMSSLKTCNIIICIVLLISFVLIGTSINVKAEENNNNADEVLPSISNTLGYSYKPLLINTTLESENITIINEEPQIVYNLDYYVNENKETMEFFIKMFDYKYEDIINDLEKRQSENDTFIYTNIGYLKDENDGLIEYDSFEKGLIEYLFSLTKSNSIKRYTKYEPYTGSSEYIEKLIMYYSDIYNNVDKTTMLSIGAAESGYYKVKFMLKYNNVYGGMSSHGLIKHNNIELGVLTYVRMMSRNYYGKGYTSIYSIGRIYCPKKVDGGKIASPHWINLVTKAKSKYNEYTDEITIRDLTKETEVL